MRYLAQCSLIALALAWVSPAAAGDLELHGYMRAGIGVATTGGPGVCYGLSNADSKYRLGNECDYVLEFAFTQHIAKLEDGADWGVTFMPAIYKTWAGRPIGISVGGLNDTNDPDSTNRNLFGRAQINFDDLPMRFNQAYVFGSNVPQLLNGTVWAGRRYYARLQTGINDMFQQNDDGDGAGLEDMKLGPAKVSVAWLMNPSTDAPIFVNGEAQSNTVKPFKLEAHAYVPTMEKGELQIYFDYNSASKTVNETLGEEPPDVFAGPNRYDIGLYHKLGGILNGELMVGGKLMASSVDRQWRVLLQQGAGFPEFRTNVDFLTMYRSHQTRPNTDADWGDAAQWFTIGARTDTQLSGPFRFLLEYGHDRTWAKDVTNNSLNKITGALAVSAGNDPWSRPTVRLYYTQAWWNEAGAPGSNAVYSHWQTGGLTKAAYGTETTGGTFGLQGETWF